MKDRIRVSVYRSSKWLDEPETREEYLKYNGTFLSYDKDSNLVIVIDDEGLLMREFVNEVRFHVDDTSSEDKPLIPKGTDVICYEGDDYEYCGKFIMFAYASDSEKNYTKAMILDLTGKIDNVYLTHIRFLLQQDNKEIKKSGDSIKDRLESI